MNIHEVTSWVFWIFKRCRHGLFWISMKPSHGYFEYSWSDVMGILNVQKLTCKYSWNDLMGILNIQKLMPWTLVFWIRSDVMELFRSWIFIVTLLFLIFIQNYVVFWIFIVMTSLKEYSKYHDVTSWTFKIPMVNTFVNIEIAHTQNTHDVAPEY